MYPGGKQSYFNTVFVIICLYLLKTLAVREYPGNKQFNSF